MLYSGPDAPIRPGKLPMLVLAGAQSGIGSNESVERLHKGSLCVLPAMRERKHGRVNLRDARVPRSLQETRCRCPPSLWAWQCTMWSCGREQAASLHAPPAPLARLSRRVSLRRQWIELKKVAFWNTLRQINLLAAAWPAHRSMD